MLAASTHAHPSHISTGRRHGSDHIKKITRADRSSEKLTHGASVSKATVALRPSIQQPSREHDPQAIRPTEPHASFFWPLTRRYTLVVSMYAAAPPSASGMATDVMRSTGLRKQMGMPLRAWKKSCQCLVCSQAGCGGRRAAEGAGQQHLNESSKCGTNALSRILFASCDVSSLYGHCAARKSQPSASDATHAP